MVGDVHCKFVGDAVSAQFPAVYVLPVEEASSALSAASLPVPPLLFPRNFIQGRIGPNI